MKYALLLYDTEGDGPEFGTPEMDAEMQEWFADQTDGKKMPDSRSIRRRITPIWKAVRREDA